MNVAAVRLLFDRGSTSAVQRLSAASRSTVVDTALRCMIAESAGAYSHRVQFDMADGSTVIAKPRARPT